jgi:hypothetical protein
MVSTWQGGPGHYIYRSALLRPSWNFPGRLGRDLDQLSIFGVHHIAFRTPVLRQVSVRKLNPLTYIKIYLKDI